MLLYCQITVCFCLESPRTWASTWKARGALDSQSIAKPSFILRIDRFFPGMRSRQLTASCPKTAFQASLVRFPSFPHAQTIVLGWILVAWSSLVLLSRTLARSGHKWALLHMLNMIGLSSCRSFEAQATWELMNSLSHECKQKVSKSQKTCQTDAYFSTLKFKNKQIQRKQTGWYILHFGFRRVELVILRWDKHE